MDALSPLLQNKWSITILVIFALLILLAFASPKIRGISKRQEEKLKQSKPEGSEYSYKAHFIGVFIGAMLGVLLAFMFSGFQLNPKAIGTGITIGAVIGEFFGIAASQG